MNPKASLSRIGRMALKLASALVGGAAAASAPVAAQSVAPEEAPPEWLAYAETATQTVTGWLQATSEQATRLRVYLDATRPAPDQPTAPVLLKIWIDAGGVVSRIEHATFAHAEANADMSALIVGQKLPASPPRNMLLPLRVLIQLPPAPPSPGERTDAIDGINRKLQAEGQSRAPVTDTLGLPERGGVNRLTLENPSARPTTPRPRPPVVPRTLH